MSFVILIVLLRFWLIHQVCGSLFDTPDLPVVVTTSDIVIFVRAFQILSAFLCCLILIVLFRQFISLISEILISYRYIRSNYTSTRSTRLFNDEQEQFTT